MQSTATGGALIGRETENRGAVAAASAEDKASELLRLMQQDQAQAGARQ